MDEGERVEHRMALKKAKLRRLRLSEQASFRDALVTLREAVRKADVLDTGYLSEALVAKLAGNTGAVPLVEQQFFLAVKTCSRNHHGDVNHEDFVECFKITLGYSKLSFEERLENNQAIKEMDTALSRADIRFSGLLPESTIRRIGVEYGIHKMRLELAMTVSPHGLGDLVKYEECLPNLQFIINGYRPSFGKSSAAGERLLKKKAEAAAAASVLGSLLSASGLGANPVTSFDDLLKRLSFSGPSAEEVAAAARAAQKDADEEEEEAREGENDRAASGEAANGHKDANVIADAAKRQAEYEEMAGAASIIQSNFRRKKAMNDFYAKMCKIYMDKRMQRRLNPSSRGVSMQIMGGNLEALETYKVGFEKPEPLRLVLKGVANRDPTTGITHDFVVVTGFTRKENGAMGPAELSGAVGLMDFLVGVNGEELVGLTFNEVMAHLRQVNYPLTLQFIKNGDMVPPDFEGWAQAYAPAFGDVAFHKEVLHRVKRTSIFQTYPDDFNSPLNHRYLELRGSELSYYKAAKGGAVSALRVGFSDTGDVESIRRVKCWDAPANQKYQLFLLMKAAGGEAVRLCFSSEREVDGWAVAVSHMADVPPAPWEDVGKDPDQVFAEEEVKYKTNGQVVQLKGGITAKFGLSAGDRCKVANVDPLKGVVYVLRLKDKREFGPFKHNDLAEAPADFMVTVPVAGYRGSMLGETETLLFSAFKAQMALEGKEVDPDSGEVLGEGGSAGAGGNAPQNLALSMLSAVGLEDAAAGEGLLGALGAGRLAGALKRKFQFAPSERVLVLRFGNLWFTAAISDAHDDEGTYSVAYDDGDEEVSVDPARVMGFSGYEYEVSDPVEAKRFGTKWYKAVVEGKNIGRPGTDPTYDIR
jgi:hypothetical protein